MPNSNFYTKVDENITNPDYGATRIIPSRFVENNWEEGGVRDFAFHEFHRVRSVPFEIAFWPKGMDRHRSFAFPPPLNCCPIASTISRLRNNAISSYYFVRKKENTYSEICRKRLWKREEGEREYLLLLPLRIDQSYSRTSESRKRVFKRRKGEKAGYLKARPSFSFLLENKEQHSRLEHRPPPCPCLLTVINARPLMCTLRRGYRLNDAQLAKKPGTMAARDPPSPPSPCSDRQRDISRETGELSNRIKPNRPRFRFAKMGIIQVGWFWVDRTTVDYNEEGPIPNVAMRTLNY